MLNQKQAWERIAEAYLLEKPRKKSLNYYIIFDGMCYAVDELNYRDKLCLYVYNDMKEVLNQFREDLNIGEHDYWINEDYVLPEEKVIRGDFCYLMSLACEDIGIEFNEED